MASTFTFSATFTTDALWDLWKWKLYYVSPQYSSTQHNSRLEEILSISALGIQFSSVQFSSVAQSSSVAESCPTLCIHAARQASLSIMSFWSPPKPMSIELVMPSNHLILCHPLLLLPSIFPSIRVFSNESALHIRFWVLGSMNYRSTANFSPVEDLLERFWAIIWTVKWWTAKTRKEGSAARLQECGNCLNDKYAYILVTSSLWL